MEEATSPAATTVARLEERIVELEKELAKGQAAPEENDEEEDFKHEPAEFSDMFEALRKSGAVKGIVMPPPAVFTGEELKKDPYALHRWYKETSCWVKARVAKDVPQAAMALQTLGGTARLAMENMESSTPGKLQSLDAIFSALLNVFQRCDPGPKAYDEFLRTRMRTDETAVDFLNRLLSLSVVIGSSKDPTVPRISDAELAARFRAGLPAWMIQRIREKHQLLVTLHQTPDISPWGLAGTAMDIEQNYANPSPGTAGKYPQRNGRVSALRDNSSSGAKEMVKTQRASKRFKDLEEKDQELITSLQEELTAFALKAKLPSHLLQRCRQLCVCDSCHRYGHSSSGCKARTVFDPKN